MERLGVSYHFTQHIEEKVAEMYENLETEEYHDLFTTALYFRVFRQHGYKISSGKLIGLFISLCVHVIYLLG